MVKTEYALDNAKLRVPLHLGAAELKTAGLAWLDCALALWTQEVFSVLTMRWYRKVDGTSVLVTELDSSKNMRTRKLLTLGDVPPEIFQRRERFDTALALLMSRTTPEHLWAALVASQLASLGAYDFVAAWTAKVGPGAALAYPQFASADEFLFYLLQSYQLPTVHPWL